LRRQQPFAHRGAGIEQVLTVVQQQQPGQRLGLCQQVLERNRSRLDPDRGGDGLGDERVVAQRRQFGQPHRLAPLVGVSRHF
jgi:hypothetical protein